MAGFLPPLWVADSSLSVLDRLYSCWQRIFPCICSSHGAKSNAWMLPQAQVSTLSKGRAANGVSLENGCQGTEWSNESCTLRS